MPRPALTLLFISANKVARADFGRGVLLDLWQTERPDVDDIGILVEVAGKLGPRLRGAVWILWSELFAHALRLDAKAVGLEGTELQSALAFEAEPISGIGGFESVVAYQQMGADKGEREFWVLQARRSDVELLRDTVSAMGGRLAGITAPAGIDVVLPAGLDPAHADEAEFRKWLGGCASLITEKKRRPAALVPEGKPLTAGRRWAIAIALMLTMGLLCAAQDRYVAKPAIAEMKAEIKKSQDAAETAKGVDKQIADAVLQKDELGKSNEQLKKSAAALGTQRRRLADLLARLADHRNDELIIQRIDSAGGELSIHGLCLQPQVATDFARKAGVSALALGWEVHSPKSQAKYLLPNGGPWSFELQFKDVLASADLLSVPKKGAGRK